MSAPERNPFWRGYWTGFIAALLDVVVIYVIWKAST